MHTAQHLVENALSGPLAGDRTIILVTHHTALCLPLASYLVELSFGNVQYRGTIQNLQEQGKLPQLVAAEGIKENNLPDTGAITLENAGDLTAGIQVVTPVRKPSSGKLIEMEARPEGQVSLRSYLTYIRAAGIIAWILILLLVIQMRLINIAAQVRRLVGHSANMLLIEGMVSSIWLGGVRRMKIARPHALTKTGIGICIGFGNAFRRPTKMSFPGS